MATNTDKNASSVVLLPGRRRAKTEGRVLHFYQNDHLATEHSDKGTRHILWSDDIAMAQLEQTKTTQILQVDQANSILCMAHNMVAYSPYGHFAAGNSTSLLAFNGQRFDLSIRGYILGNGYRIYSPLRGAFFSWDTWAPFYRGILNGYSYSEGDPINRVDPSGHFSFKPLKNFFAGRKTNKMNRIKQYNQDVENYNKALSDMKLYDPYKRDGTIDFPELHRNREKIGKHTLSSPQQLSSKDTAYAQKHNIAIKAIDNQTIALIETSKELISYNTKIMNDFDKSLNQSPDLQNRNIRTSTQQWESSFFDARKPRDRFKQDI